MLRNMLTMVSAGVLFLSALGAPALAQGRSATTPTASEFGFGTMRIQPRRAKPGGVLARGVRPMLLIMAEFRDRRFTADHTERYFERTYFGPGSKSVAGYFSEISGGVFTYRNAGIIRFMVPDNRATRDRDESLWPGGYEHLPLLDHAIKTLARTNRFDFKRFDSDRDGLVTTDELTIVLIAAQTQDGATRPRNVGTSQGVRLKGNMCYSGGARGFNIICHELMHSLDEELGYDLYGRGRITNAELSILGGRTGPENTIYHLDPWFKMRLGWTAPRIMRVKPGGGVVTLTAPQLRGRRLIDTQRPVILYSPDKGTREFFILEYRNPDLGGYDVNAKSRGLVVWRIKTDARGQLMLRPFAGTPAGRYWTDQYVGLSTSPGQGALPPSNVAFALKYFDNSDSGIRVRSSASARTTRSITVDWGVRRKAYSPVTSTRNLTIKPGQRFHVNGTFGVREGQLVSLVSAGRSYNLGIYSWSDPRIVLDTPRTALPGRYRLVIYGDSSRQAVNLGIPTTVEPLSLSRPVPGARVTPVGEARRLPVPPVRARTTDVKRKSSRPPIDTRRLKRNDMSRGTRLSTRTVQPGGMIDIVLPRKFGSVQRVEVVLESLQQRRSTRPVKLRLKQPGLSGNRIRARAPSSPKFANRNWRVTVLIVVDRGTRFRASAGTLRIRKPNVKTSTRNRSRGSRAGSRRK